MISSDGDSSDSSDGDGDSGDGDGDSSDGDCGDGDSCDSVTYECKGSLWYLSIEGSVIVYSNNLYNVEIVETDR